MRGLARIYDVRMEQFVQKIEELSHIMGPRGSQDSRSPSLIMAPDHTVFLANQTRELIKHIEQPSKTHRALEGRGNVQPSLTQGRAFIYNLICYNSIYANESVALKCKAV